jgi:hypothetical protein
MGVPLLGHTLTCEALILWGTDVAGVATSSRCGRVRTYPGPIPHK